MRRSSDDQPGWQRQRCGRGFRYLDADGRALRSQATLARIRELAIPPAYRDVWICADPRGHLQVTARDARGRKQYRYHPEWQQQRATRKFQRVARFVRSLPAIRAQLARDLRREGLPQARVLAAVVTLLDLSGQRIGGREYLRRNGSFGLTTVRDTHLRYRQQTAQLCFNGKGGAAIRIDITHPPLLRTLQACRALPGDALFQYLDAQGRVRAVDAADVNAYLRKLAGERCSAKDFRTLKACVELLHVARRDGITTARALDRAIREVAGTLGHTPAICRASYLDPRVVEACLEGALPDVPAIPRYRRQEAERDLAAIVGA